MTRRSIFRAAFFSDRLLRRQPDETLTLMRSLWSDKWETCRPNTKALRRKHFAFWNTGSSPARGRRVRPQAADKQLSVHSHSHGQMYSVNACLYVTVCAVTLVKEDILSLLSEERNYLASFFFKSFLPVWPTAKIISCFLCKLTNFKGHSDNRQYFWGTSTWNCCLLT